MTEIEKMKRYIERTPKVSGSYSAGTKEVLAIIGDAPSGLETVAFAFKYGQAKGYRAAKAEGRARA